MHILFNTVILRWVKLCRIQTQLSCSLVLVLLELDLYKLVQTFPSHCRAYYQNILHPFRRVFLFIRYFYILSQFNVLAVLTFPSYSRKAVLFGLVVVDLHEA